jgi:hypothetical protein
MTMSVFTDYSQRLKADGSTWLGVMTWYSALDSIRVRHDRLKDLCEQTGLDHLTPERPQDDDVFRRVCSAGQRKKVPTSNPDVFENYLIRDVKVVAGTVYKHLVVETVDRSNRVLAYRPVIELAYDPDPPQGTANASWVPLGGIPDQAAEDIAKGILNAFVLDRGSVNGNVMRSFIRKVLADANATVVRDGGGVYFVMANRADAVTALEALSDHVDGMQVHSLPLIDDEKQRALIRQAIEADSVGAIDELLREIETIEKGDKEITERRYANLAAKVTEIQAKAKEYAELLDDALEGTEFRQDILRKKMRRLLNKVAN